MLIEYMKEAYPNFQVGLQTKLRRVSEPDVAGATSRSARSSRVLQGRNWFHGLSILLVLTPLVSKASKKRFDDDADIPSDHWRWQCCNSTYPKAHVPQEFKSRAQLAVVDLQAGGEFVPSLEGLSYCDTNF